MRDVDVGVAGGTELTAARVHEAAVVRKPTMLLSGHATAAAVADGDSAEPESVFALVSGILGALGQDATNHLKRCLVNQRLMLALEDGTFPADLADVEGVLEELTNVFYRKALPSYSREPLLLHHASDV